MTEKTDLITNEIETARKEGANLLLPSTSIAGLSEFHAPVVDSVYLSPNPDDGDVYPADNSKDCKKFRPTKTAISKLSICAGLLWHPTETRRTDPMNDKNYISFQAVGGIRKADGAVVWFKAEYDLDFEVIEQELLDLYSKKVEYWKQGQKTDEQFKNEKLAYINSCVRRDLLQKRKHKLKLCETGAMNRVVRFLLGLKQAYTVQELQKPFVMVRIVFQPDYNDEKVRQIMLEKGLSAQAAVYGGGSVPTNLDARAPVIDVPHQDVTEPIPEGPAEPYPSGPPGETAPAPGPGPGMDDKNKNALFDFGNLEPAEQVKELINLISRKAFKFKDLPDQMKNLNDCSEKTFSTEPFLLGLTEQTRLNFFGKLITLPDDDIPF